MNYIELLKKSSEKFSSIVCMGMDPVVEDIPESGTTGQKIYSFYEAILDRMTKRQVYPGAVKPNYAFYAQYGLEGIDALSKLISIYKSEGIPVILDVKRGDIGTTAKAYSKEAYEFFKADSVTLSPYMGYDSISPFLDAYPDRGCYILTKTSNKSSSDIQDVMTGGEPLYIHVAKKILDWHKPGIGSVVGATFPDQLLKISGIFHSSGREVPLLIPGVGSQGGSVEETVRILKTHGDIRIHRINSSSAINYAYKKLPDMHYADAAVEALRELNGQIGL
ncbi:MAG: orotidine-5'-phosphate decarboxylase [Spirochaetes bacterium]|jgi:orotidine-5'-phosphate decarboxylase|nr:orotidine-5'-phosphate decarboxylase [Spirochaetota bacterium]